MILTADKPPKQNYCVAYPQEEKETLLSSRRYFLYYDLYDSINNADKHWIISGDVRYGGEVSFEVEKGHLSVYGEFPSVTKNKTHDIHWLIEKAE